MHCKTPEGRIHEVTLVVDLWIYVASSQPSIYKEHMVLDPLVRRLGTTGNLRSGVSKGSKAQSYESHRFEDTSGIFLDIRFGLWSSRR